MRCNRMSRQAGGFDDLPADMEAIHTFVAFIVIAIEEFIPSPAYMRRLRPVSSGTKHRGR